MIHPVHPVVASAPALDTANAFVVDTAAADALAAAAAAIATATAAATAAAAPANRAAVNILSHVQHATTVVAHQGGLKHHG